MDSTSFAASLTDGTELFDTKTELSSERSAGTSTSLELSSELLLSMMESELMTEKGIKMKKRHMVRREVMLSALPVSLVAIIVTLLFVTAEVRENRLVYHDHETASSATLAGIGEHMNIKLGIFQWVRRAEESNQWNSADASIRDNALYDVQGTALLLSAHNLVSLTRVTETDLLEMRAHWRNGQKHVGLRHTDLVQRRTRIRYEPDSLISPNTSWSEWSTDGDALRDVHRELWYQEAVGTTPKAVDFSDVEAHLDFDALALIEEYIHDGNTPHLVLDGPHVEEAIKGIPDSSTVVTEMNFRASQDVIYRIQVSTDALSQILATVNIGKAGRVAVVHEDGRVIAHADSWRDKNKNIHAEVHTIATTKSQTGVVRRSLLSLSELEAPISAVASRLVDVADNHHGEVIDVEFSDADAQEAADRHNAGKEYTGIDVDADALAAYEVHEDDHIDAGFVPTHVRVDRVPGLPWMAVMAALRDIHNDPTSEAMLVGVQIMLVALLLLMIARAVFSVYEVLEQFKMTVKLVEATRITMKAGKMVKKAQAQSDAKSRFVSVMSHELRNPLTGVLLNTDFLMATKLNAQQKTYCRGIGQSTKVLLTILNDILDVTKIEANRLTLEEIDFNLHEIVENLIETSAPAAFAKDIDLVSIIAADVPRKLRGDPTRLRQIAQNLVSNAIKFTERGSVTLEVHIEQTTAPFDDSLSDEPKLTKRAKRKQARITARGGGAGSRTSDSNSMSTENVNSSGGAVLSSESVGAVSATDLDSVVIRFTCKDTGKGIDRLGQRRLFKEFSQVDTSTTREFGGTGLGLYICKQLVGLMKGRIGVRSQVGIGSEFAFTVQLQRPLGDGSGASADDTARSVSQLNTTVKSAAGRWYVLICVESEAVERAIKTYMSMALGNADALFMAGTTRLASAWREVNQVMEAAEGKSVQLREAKNRNRPPTRFIVICDWAFVTDKVRQHMQRVVSGTVNFVHPISFVLLAPKLGAEEVQAYADMGWGYVLTKPVKMTAIFESVQRMATAVVRGTPSGSNGALGSKASKKSVVSAKKKEAEARKKAKKVAAEIIGNSSQSDDGDNVNESDDGSEPDSSLSLSDNVLPSARNERRRDDVVSKSHELSALVMGEKNDAPLILVVDDFDLMRELVSKVVQGFGCRAMTAIHGADALEVLHEHPDVSMMFLDCEMPVMDGFTTVKKVRARPEDEKRRLPIVAMTANAFHEDRKRCYDVGFDDFVAKPLTAVALRDVIKRWLPKLQAEMQSMRANGGAADDDDEAAEVSDESDDDEDSNDDDKDGAEKRVKGIKGAKVKGAKAAKAAKGTKGAKEGKGAKSKKESGGGKKGKKPKRHVKKKEDVMIPWKTTSPRKKVAFRDADDDDTSTD